MSTNLNLQTRAAFRYLSEGRRGIDWVWFQCSDAFSREAFAQELVKAHDPLAYEAGTAEWRFRAYVEREAQRLVLAVFFDAVVKDGDHWKERIDTVLDMDPGDANLAGAIRRAVEFFTATTPTFHTVDGEPGKVRVRAAGYYGGPAA